MSPTHHDAGWSPVSSLTTNFLSVRAGYFTLISVLCLLLTVTLDSMQCVIVTVHGYTHLLTYFFLYFLPRILITNNYDKYSTFFLKIITVFSMSSSNRIDDHLILVKRCIL